MPICQWDEIKRLTINFHYRMNTLHSKLGRNLRDDLHFGGFVRWVPLERVRGGESFADSRTNIRTEVGRSYPYWINLGGLHCWCSHQLLMHFSSCHIQKFQWLLRGCLRVGGWTLVDDSVRQLSGTPTHTVWPSEHTCAQPDLPWMAQNTHSKAKEEAQNWI